MGNSPSGLENLTSLMSIVSFRKSYQRFSAVSSVQRVLTPVSTPAESPPATTIIADRSAVAGIRLMRYCPARGQNGVISDDNSDFANAARVGLSLSVPMTTRVEGDFFAGSSACGGA